MCLFSDAINAVKTILHFSSFFFSFISKSLPHTDDSYYNTKKGILHVFRTKSPNISTVLFGHKSIAFSKILRYHVNEEDYPKR